AVLAVGAAVGIRALSSDGAEAPQAAASPRAISGDVRTADPCPLLDMGALGRFGGVAPSAGSSPSGCRADVTAPDGRPAQLTASFSRGIAVDGGSQQVGDLTVQRGRTGAGGGADARLCVHGVVLPDGNQVLLRAYSFTSGIAPCDLADAGLDSAVASLQRDGVRYDPNRNADFSLARADACQAVDAAALGRAGLGATPFPGFASWSCSWGTAENYASVSFGGTTRRTGIAGGEGPAIADRKSYVESELGSCSVTVAHREGAGPDDRLETVTTTVRVPGAQQDRVCGAATDLATTAESRIPR
ncbi:MAG: hypothetical protein M3235_04460, partial [Actinomycetota bacterium]|nr:hypothetical protein [Actinomycetota bacterium]